MTLCVFVSSCAIHAVPAWVQYDRRSNTVSVLDAKKDAAKVSRSSDVFDIRFENGWGRSGGSISVVANGQYASARDAINALISSTTSSPLGLASYGMTLSTGAPVLFIQDLLSLSCSYMTEEGASKVSSLVNQINDDFIYSKLAPLERELFSGISTNSFSAVRFVQKGNPFGVIFKEGNDSPEVELRMEDNDWAKAQLFENGKETAELTPAMKNMFLRVAANTPKQRYALLRFVSLFGWTSVCDNEFVERARRYVAKYEEVQAEVARLVAGRKKNILGYADSAKVPRGKAKEPRVEKSSGSARSASPGSMFPRRTSRIGEKVAQSLLIAGVIALLGFAAYKDFMLKRETS